MDRDRSALRTTSKLEVFAPSPTVLNPQDRTSEIRRQRRLRRRKKSGLESPTPVPEVQTNRLSQSGSPPNDSNVESVQESYEPEFTITGAIASLPSWLVSFVVHLSLILILALWTWSANHDGAIHLELGEAAVDQLDSMSMQIAFDEPDMEDSLDSMETPEMETELSLDIELEETIPQELDEVDPYAMTELQEFAAAKPQPDAGSNASSSDSGAKAADGDKTGTEFFGTKSYGSDFVFVIDASSSMMTYYRWNLAVRELLNTLDQLEDEQNFLVLLYNDRTYMMFGAPIDQKLVPASQANKAKIKQWLQAALPFGGTRPGDAMRLALRKKPDAIYFLSDGELRDNTMFNLRFWNKPVKRKDGLEAKIPIHTISLGANSGRLTMKTIAKENNGIFTPVN